MEQRASLGASAEEIAALDALFRSLLDAWNAGSGERFAAVFTPDGHLIGFDGTHFRGRAEIAPFHQQLFETHLRGSRLTGELIDVTLLAPDVALLHARGGTLLRGERRPAASRDSVQTLVAVRLSGEWRLKAFQNTRVRPIGQNVGGTLFWLVGDRLWGAVRPRH